ncbi:hypothetical protein [Tengunoibacter tsumagoiensis]|uniref:Uncharacterized protein n=1 Tax=Tengunoibacter tsumagoiensis TaxID=2014871 RepID=A0A402A8U1_9CHLR|nr:hypothetical protein [Tengunoibacter tsumagoiensis]GCE15580.1 hypothetical protein KTT_54390 [Tengunoibacter tsumagoiensis]
METQQQDKQRIRRREKIMVVGTGCYAIFFLAALFVPFVIYLMIPVFQTVISVGLFVGLWLFSWMVTYILVAFVLTRYITTTFALKHAWLSRYGIESKATITRYDVKRHVTPSGDEYPSLCFELSWSHPISSTPISIWKKLPSDVCRERHSYDHKELSEECLRQLEYFKPEAPFTVLCDPTDPFFFLTIHPIKPSHYPLPTPQGHLVNSANVRRFLR